MSYSVAKAKGLENRGQTFYIEVLFEARGFFKVELTNSASFLFSYFHVFLIL